MNRSELVGNRWVLVGGVLYLLEWVGIIAAGAAGVGEIVVRGTPLSDLRDSYAHPDAVAFLAGWLAVVLLGRILVFIGVRKSLADSGRAHVLMDVAVAAAAVSVTIEIASYGLSVGAAEAAKSGDEAGMVLLDQAGMGVNLMLFSGLGVAIVCSAYAMTRSGLFPRTLNVFAWLSGVALVAAQLVVSPSFQDVLDVLFLFPILFWVWMIWTGVLLWRRTPAAVPA